VLLSRVPILFPGRWLNARLHMNKLKPSVVTEIARTTLIEASAAVKV